MTGKLTIVPPPPSEEIDKSVQVLPPSPPPLSNENTIVAGPGWTPSKTNASKFLMPKKFETSAGFLHLPKIVPTIHVSHLALLKIYILVSTIDMEVGWLGTAKRDGNNITVDDVFLFEQDVSYGHTELTTESMSNTMMEVLQREDGEEIFNNTRFWGHSHGSGGTGASGQDDQTMHIFGNFGSPFFLRGIFNRVGSVSFSLYDWENNVVFHNVPWDVSGKSVSMKTFQKLREDLRKEMLEKVVYQVPKPFSVPVGTYVPSKVRSKARRREYGPFDPRRYLPNLDDPQD